MGSKGSCKKTSFFKFCNFGLHFLKEKDRDIYFYFEGYGKSKRLAIIQDFKAHWAIKNKQMVNVWKLIHLESGMFSYIILALNQSSKHSPFAYSLSPSELKTPRP